MKRILPSPLLSLALFGLWLLLNRSASMGHVLLATCLAIAIPLLTAGLRPRPVRVRLPGSIVIRSISTLMRLASEKGPARESSHPALRAARICLSTSRAAAGIGVPGPKMPLAPAAYRVS